MRMLRIVFILFLLLKFSAGFAQSKHAYSLNITSQQTQGRINFLGMANEPLRLIAEVRPEAFGLDKPIRGNFKIFASADSIFSPNDLVVLDSACTLPDYSYQSFPIKHSLKPGSYYLFAQFFAKDTNLFEAQSAVVKLSAELIGFTVQIKDIWFSRIKTSEYSEETNLFAEIDLTLTGNTVSIGSLRSEWAFGLTKGKKTEAFNSIYRTDSLPTGRTTIALEEKIFNNPDFKSFNQVSIKLTSAYFSEGYIKIPDVTFNLPIKVVTDIDQLNAFRRKRDPYLTYGSFILKQEAFDSLAVEKLYSEAEQFYSIYHASLQAASQKQFKQAIHLADSAFAFVGTHRASGLLYIEAALVSDLYSGLFKYLQALQPQQEQPELNFKLGEAMKMADLMTSGYAHLLNRMLPDSLDHYNEMEKSGFFDKPEMFRQPLITDFPILWKTRSVPTLEHFIRNTDYESADQIIDQVNRHVTLLKPVWEIIRADTAMSRHFSYAATTATEQNNMLDFLQARLSYYAASGLYADGEEAVADAVLAWQCGYKFSPEKLWVSVANFYETLGDFKAADSLYALSDTHFKNKYKETPNSTWLLKGKNQALLQARLGKPVALSDSLTQTLEEVRKQNFLAYLDLLNDQTLAQKLAYFGNPVYKNFYINRIEQLEDQYQSFAANEWKKDLAFLLGREGQYRQSLMVYKNLFILENPKAVALRLGFSEEAQLFFAQRQRETLSRYLSVVAEFGKTASGEAYDSALRVGLQQVLFQHSFILRGNFQLLYDVSRSTDQQVANSFVLWQTLREHLNELYVKGEPNEKELTAWKKYLLETEEKLIRSARDTASMKLDYVQSLDSIRTKLKPDEAAIEIVRLQQNHKVYYSNSPTYAALIIKKNGPLQFVVFPAAGADMEGKFYKRYRNSILFQQRDANSYTIFWGPLAKQLAGIKTIYWAPDGVFNLINLNALLNPATHQYLVAEYKILTVPTVANIHVPKAIEFKSATVLGNPTFSDKPTLKKDTLRTSREFLTREAITSLPGTATEADAISALLKKQNTVVTQLTKQNATKQALFKNSNRDVLHLATHGFWLDKPGSSSAYHNLFATLAGSGLILAGAQKFNSTNDFTLLPAGILTSAEIQDLNLFNTNLVVLSACETGLGEIIPGEGLYGLKRALMRAGAQNIITSLWKVDDDATMQFMTSFYTQLATSKNLPDAFQQAMLQLKEKYPQPYYWGAFVLTQN
jgi:CHAT domain-containing protein